MLDIKGYCKTFHAGTPNEVQALRHVTLSIPDGSFVVVIGTNGSGKSTLLNAVAGVFTPDKGQVTLDGHDITTWPEHRRATLIGRVFQNPFSGTAPAMTIAENLAMAARRGRFPAFSWAVRSSFLDECRDRIRTLRMGLEDRLDTPIGGLSGGQRQALTLLMATWRNPALLLLDEHTAALDPRSADRIIQLTNEIVTSNRLTTLMVTHSMNQAANLGDRLVMMHRGEVVRDSSRSNARQRQRPEELLAHFDQLRRREMLDEAAAGMLREQYI